MPDQVTLTVLYPRDDSSTFDMSYYLSTHMPMAQKAWKSHGLLSWHTTELAAPAPYSCQSTIFWEAKGDKGMDNVAAGTSSDDGKALAEDVKNFSNRTPIVLVGPVKASG